MSSRFPPPTVIFMTTISHTFGCVNNRKDNAEFRITKKDWCEKFVSNYSSCLAFPVVPEMGYCLFLSSIPACLFLQQLATLDGKSPRGRVNRNVLDSSVKWNNLNKLTGLMWPGTWCWWEPWKLCGYHTRVDCRPGWSWVRLYYLTELENKINLFCDRHVEPIINVVPSKGPGKVKVVLVMWPSCSLSGIPLFLRS